MTKKIRWALGYTDGKTHTQFELDKKFRRIGFAGGKQSKTNPVDAPQSEMFDVEIVAGAAKITTRINGLIVDQTPDAPNLATGKFVFLLGDKDEIGVSGFVFVPAR